MAYNDSVHPSVVAGLSDLRARLERTPSSPWDGVRTWASSARPLFRSELMEHLSDFEAEVTAPTWAAYPMVISEDLYGARTDNFAEASAAEDRENDRLAAQRKASILAFLDGLISVLGHQSRVPSSGAALQRAITLVDGFERVCRALGRRSHGRAALLMTDEYDVQYLFGALLNGTFDDVRPEEPTPSHGGGGARMDFLVKSERLVVELKMTREGLADRHVTDQLIVDIGRYESHPDCDALVCFVYDPAFRLKNPRAIENDLTRRHGRVDVHVLVRPS